MPTDAPPDAEKQAILEGLRQAYAMIAAQKRLGNPASEACKHLDVAMTNIQLAAEKIKA